MRLLGQLSLSMLVATSATSAFAQTTVNQPAAEPAAAPKAVQPAWFERMNLMGDFRLRTENVQAEGTDARIRNRILARLGVTAKVNENVNATIRLGTGNFGAPNITSYNVTMGTSSDKKPIWLDLAFVDWKVFPTTSVQIGKQNHPFFTPGKQQLVWDSDLTLEGGSVRFNREVESFRYFANFGGFWLAEQHGAPQSANDGLLGAAQIGAGYKSEALSGVAAVGYYSHRVEGTQFNLSDSSAGGSPVASTNFKGNSVTGNRYNYNYDEINGSLEIGTDRLPIPVLVYGDYVVNAGPEKDNVGQLYGIRLGRVKDVGSLAFDYNYRILEKDAALGIFTDSDFAGGGTDVRGHRFGLQYQAAQNTLVSATYIGSENNVSTTKTFYELAQLDFTFSF